MFIIVMRCGFRIGIRQVPKGWRERSAFFVQGQGVKSVLDVRMDVCVVEAVFRIVVCEIDEIAVRPTKRSNLLCFSIWRSRRAHEFPQVKHNAWIFTHGVENAFELLATDMAPRQSRKLTNDLDIHMSIALF